MTKTGPKSARRPGNSRLSAPKSAARAVRSTNHPSANNRQGRQAAFRAPLRRSRLIAGAAATVVVAIIAALVVVKLAGSGGLGGAPRQPAPASAIAKLTSIPLAALTEASAKAPSLTSPMQISDPRLTSAGKPELLFISAEFCPVCATERWPLLVALARFGTFSNLSQTHSALSDGNIATVSFYGSTYASPYLTFVPLETTTNQPSGSSYKTLEIPTAAEYALWQTKQPQGRTLPFIDIAGQWLLETSQYPAAALQGSSFNDIADAIGSNQNTIGADVDASALVLIKDICAVTDQQPAATCQTVTSSQGK